MTIFQCMPPPWSAVSLLRRIIGADGCAAGRSTIGVRPRLRVREIVLRPRPGPDLSVHEKSLDRWRDRGLLVAGESTAQPMCRPPLTANSAPVVKPAGAQ